MYYAICLCHLLGRSDGGFRGESGATSRIGFEPLFVCNDSDSDYLYLAIDHLK